MNTYICVFFLLLGHKANHFHLVFCNFSLFLFFAFWKRGTNFKRGVGCTQRPPTLRLWVIYLFSGSLYNYKGKLSPFIVKKMFIEIVFKEVWGFKRFLNLSVFGFFFTVIKRTMIFMMKKIFIEIILRNLMTYVFKEHVKIVKIYMVKVNVSILNSLKIMGFL